MTNEVEVLPSWRQAVKEAVETFTFGEIIPREWLEEKFGIEIPPTFTIGEYKRIQFDMMQNMDQFREALLIDHQMYLSCIRGEGYLIVQPSAQTSTSMRKLGSEIKRGLQTAAKTLTNIKHEMLTERQLQHNINAQGTVARLATFSHKSLGLRRAKSDPIRKLKRDA